MSEATLASPRRRARPKNVVASSFSEESPSSDADHAAVEVRI